MARGWSEAAGDGGWFGAWSSGEDGVPAFDVGDPVAIGGRTGVVLPDGGAGALWHQVANAGITATAHADGGTTVWATDRGVTRLTGDGRGWRLLGAPSVPGARRARWVPGGAVWTDRVATAAGPVRIERRLSVLPGTDAVLRVDVTLVGPTGALDGATWEECWRPDPYPLVLGGLMSPAIDPPDDVVGAARFTWRALYRTSAVSRAATDRYRRAFARLSTYLAEPRPGERSLVFVPTRPVRDAPAVAAATGATGASRAAGAVEADPPPAWFDLHLPRLVITVLSTPGDDTDWSAVELDPVAGSVQVALDGRAEQHLTLAVALAVDDDDARRLAALAAAPGHEPAAAARSWAGLVEVSGTGHPVLEREAAWHGAYLVGAETFDAAFGRRFVAQGSAYQFVHGLHGAPRDYCIFAVPLALIDPVAAREQLEVVLRMTRPSGSMVYAHTGRGRLTSGGIHAAPTDLPLFLLWALTEYVWSTGDVAFLDRVVPFAPPDDGPGGTVRERVLLAWRYVRDRIGRGGHGLLRVGSGDWADPISAMVPDRHAFHERGESGFNTALGVFALPRAADLIGADHPGEAEAMRAFAGELRAAMADAWAGDWFLRGFDGLGGPVGDGHLFVDGQVWALIAGIGTDEQRSLLVRALTERCVQPSPIGATILDRPHPNRAGMLAPGWDCNGGVWAAINALLAWGLAAHDPIAAWDLVERQSLAAHARAYPGVWYGVWSGPDAYNAWFGSRPGETFVQPATPMTEYPVMNANAHAGPLLALLRALGVETGPGGLVVHPGRAPAGWRFATPAVVLTGEGAEPTGNPHSPPVAADG